VLDHLAIAHEQLRKDPDAASRIRAGIAELPD
jgi:hypothetical protein